MRSVKLITCCSFYVFYCRVYKELKMFDCERAAIDVMEGGDAVVIADVRLQGVKELFSFDEADLGDVRAEVRDISYQLMVKTKLFTGNASLYIRTYSLKFLNVVEKSISNIITIKCFIVNIYFRDLSG